MGGGHGLRCVQAIEAAKVAVLEILATVGFGAARINRVASAESKSAIKVKVTPMLGKSKAIDHGNLAVHESVYIFSIYFCMWQFRL